MAKHFTKNDVLVAFRGTYDVNVPKGTELVAILNGGGRIGYAVATPFDCDPRFADNALFRFDATHYYIWVDEKHVQTIEQIEIAKAKSDYNRFAVACEIQNAGNLKALAREFVKVVDAAFDECKSTTGAWDDPAVVLFVNKFESLCRSEARYSAAYSACREKAEAAEVLA